ncbi:hypothetical protein KSF78_0008036 [Schistosoma japonicum]|nr:hypothetical protein KSF78_0008036 [Schistosoma japonicum]
MKLSICHGKLVKPLCQEYLSQKKLVIQWNGLKKRTICSSCHPLKMICTGG